MKMKTKVKLLVAGLGVVLVGAMCLHAAASRKTNETLANSPAMAQEVKIDNFTFAPASVTVAQGTTVRWVNRDDIPHTVVSDDKTTFKSKPLDTDQEFSYTFTKQGTYPYFCSIHPKMTGKIVVQ
jgi:plastocyanin